MVLQLLMRLMSRFVNNEQTVSRLAESYPIRRSAQLLAYLYHRSKDVVQSGQWPQAGQRAVTFRNRFLNELRHEMQQAKEKLEKERRS